MSIPLWMITHTRTVMNVVLVICVCLFVTCLLAHQIRLAQGIRSVEEELRIETLRADHFQAKYEECGEIMRREYYDESQNVSRKN